MQIIVRLGFKVKGDLSFERSSRLKKILFDLLIIAFLFLRLSLEGFFVAVENLYVQ